MPGAWFFFFEFGSEFGSSFSLESKKRRLQAFIKCNLLWQNLQFWLDSKSEIFGIYREKFFSQPRIRMVIFRSRENYSIVDLSWLLLMIVIGEKLWVFDKVMSEIDSMEIWSVGGPSHARGNFYRQPTSEQAEGPLGSTWVTLQTMSYDPRNHNGNIPTWIEFFFSGTCFLEMSLCDMGPIS